MHHTDCNTALQLSQEVAHAVDAAYKAKFDYEKAERRKEGGDLTTLKTALTRARTAERHAVAELDKQRLEHHC